MYGNIVYSLEQLKEIYDSDAHGIKGMWAFHRNFHKGHDQCRRITLENSDWVVGILWNNFSEGMELLTGKTVDYDDEISQSDVDVLQNNSDIVMIFTGDYHPYMEYKDFIYNVIDKDFSYDVLKNMGIIDSVGMWGSLVYSIAVRLMIHEIHGIKLDYHGVCAKEIWRWGGYKEWCMKRFGLYLDTQEPVSDEFGNNYSTMKVRMTEEYKKQIDRKLMLPHFTSIEDVKEHIKDIKDLKVKNFSKDRGWIRCQFYFNEKLWWTEVVKYQSQKETKK